MKKANLLQLLKVLVFILSVWLIYREIWLNAKWSLFEETAKGLLAQPPILLLLAFLMVWINWGIEMLKWKDLMSGYQQISLWEGYKAILTGVFVSMFTPNRIGEFAGRIVYLKSKQKLAAILTTMAGSLSQFICTILFGSIGLMFIGHKTDFFQVSQALLISMAGFILVILLGLYFNLSVIYRAAILLRVPHQFSRLLLPFLRLDRALLARVLLLSVLRYLVFAFQYGLLLKWVMIDLGFFELIMGVSVVFLIQTLIPTFLLSELTLRGAGATQVFTLLGAEAPPILIAAYGIWILNILIPALTGGLLFLTNKKDDIDI